MPSLSDTGRPAFYAIPPSRRLHYTGFRRARPGQPLIVWIKTLFVLSPGVENPAAQAGIDCSFCASDTRLRRGPGQCTKSLRSGPLARGGVSQEGG
jgi:hypothetical protein